MLKSYSQTAIALGSKTTFMLVTEATSATTIELFQKLWQLTFNFERQFSRFLPASELSKFNNSAGIRTPVTTEFHDLLIAARTLSLQTGNTFNPFILPALQKAGYHHSHVPGYENDPLDDHTTKTVVLADTLTIGDDWAEIPYGTAIDMGGIGKGYLADKLAQALPATLGGYWLSLGGDIVAAGYDELSQPWHVAIQDAANLEHDSAYLLTTGGSSFGLATSSVLNHRGRYNGVDWHHIIDPRTNRPAISDVRLATVYGANAMTADVLAKVSIILGPKTAWKTIQPLGALALLLQYEVHGKIVTKVYGNGIQTTS